MSTTIDAPTRQDVPEADRASPVRTALLRAGTAIGAQATVLAALLYYFGLVRNAAMTDYLGGTESHIDASVQWHMLSSVQALFTPLLVAAGAALAWRIAHHALVRVLPARPRARRWCCAMLASAVVVAPLTAWLGTRASPGWWELGLPLSSTVGVLLAWYGGSLWTRTSQSREEHRHREMWPAAAGVYAAALVVVLMFWTVGTLAAIQGRGEGERFTRTLDQQLGVTLFTAEDLRLELPGVWVTVYPGPGAYRYRYQGLKLYAYSGGKLFLVPAGWTYDEPRLVVLPEGSGMRVEYVGP